MHLVDKKIGRLYGFRYSKAFTLLELAIVVVIFLVVLTALAPFIHIAKDWAGIVNCSSNIRQLSLGIHRYAADHNGDFPARLYDLYPAYAKDERFFYCPSLKGSIQKNGSGYEYTAGLSKSSPGDSVIIRDTESNHARLGSHVLKVNGSLELLRKDRGAVAKR